MKVLSLIALAVVIAFCASAATATSVGWSVAGSADVTTYTYALTSSELNDWITSFHIYAPLNPALVSHWTAPAGWEFMVEPDPDTEGADIYWFATDPIDNGLAYGSTMVVSISVPAILRTANDYVVPGCFGNWGYETYNYAMWGVLVSLPSVPVPEGELTPEPCSLMALAGGVMLLGIRKRR